MYSTTTDTKFQIPITAAVTSALAKSNIIPAKDGDNTRAVRSIVRKTAFIVANLFSFSPATTTIQSFSTTIFCPTDARFPTFAIDITIKGTTHLGISYEEIVI